MQHIRNAAAEDECPRTESMSHGGISQGEMEEAAAASRPAETNLIEDTVDAAVGQPRGARGGATPTQRTARRRRQSGHGGQGRAECGELEPPRPYDIYPGARTDEEPEQSWPVATGLGAIIEGNRQN